MNPSSSSSLPFPAPLQEKYDVFLSFRGEDTRLGFTSHLHKALLGKKVETYIDDRLVRGDEIAPALFEAIARSTISVIIFSENYASSTWCLKELVHILGCKKSHGQIVIPIFYRIDPSDVRKQQGTYALEDRPLKRSRDEVATWRAALEEAANMSGFHYSSKTGRTEADFVEEVVRVVLTKLKSESSSDLRGLFGIQRKIEKIESLLCLDSPCVCCVGIWGMGGIGKTTLATAVFHRLASKFEAYCFLANVREKSETGGLIQLLQHLVREILKDEYIKIGTLSIPPEILIRLRRTKALIVLDDVNAWKQLEVLVGDHDWFCQGSRIIITARDKGLLEQKVDQAKIFNVEGLGSDDALRLFYSHAKPPTTDYSELSREVLEYIKGIPLALKVMGSLLHRCKSKQEWEDQWKKLKQFPSKEIEKVLRISYDGLEENEKEIFLDIACFHKYSQRNDVKELLDIRGFFGEVGINDLIDRSLISISGGRWIEMHDLVEEMGKAIAQEEGSRLLMAKDVNQLLANNQSNGRVQAISIHWFEMEYANFEKMRELRFLRVHSSYVDLATSLIGSLGLPNSLRCLCWYGYPLKSLPSKFSAQNLVVLEMPWSQVEGQLWNEDQSPVNLKWIDLARSKHLTKVPDLSRSRKIEHIKLSDCKRLVEIPSYFQHLGKLTHLDLRDCTNLKNLPEMPYNLEFLDLFGTAIEELPSSVWSHEKISHLVITSCKHLKSLPSNSCKLKGCESLSLKGCESLCEFWELPRDTTELALTSSSLVSLPTNIWKLKSLKSLDLENCSNFKEIPPSIRNLVALRELDLHDCKNLEVVPDELFCLTSLQVLNLSGTEIKSLPTSIKQAAQLSLLSLNSCKSLESLPELPPSLKRIARVILISQQLRRKYMKELLTNKKCLDCIDLSGCSKLYFPEILEPMKHLECLNLSGTAVKELPPSIRNLVALRVLDLHDTAVKELPPSIRNLVALRVLDLHDCKNLEVVPDELFCLTPLQVLNLSGTEIKSLPASIKQAAQLSRMLLNCCKRLEYLPELPPLLQCLDARGCTSLKTVSSSSTAIAQGWETYKFSRWLREKHTFSNCRRLDENARSNIMGDAQLRIMRMATASSKFKEDKIEKASYNSNEESYVGIICCGDEIPKWFSHKSEGCSIKIELPRDWFSTDFLGFALSLVVVAASSRPRIGCKYNFKTSNGESREVNHPLCLDSYEVCARESFPGDQVFVWCLCGAQRPTTFYKLVTEVNVDFTVMDYYKVEDFTVMDYYKVEKIEVKVKKCGICLLYGKDAEMIKQRAL